MSICIGNYSSRLDFLKNNHSAASVGQRMTCEKSILSIKGTILSNLPIKGTILSNSMTKQRIDAPPPIAQETKLRPSQYIGWLLFVLLVCLLVDNNA
jgi:hypothetical protein